LASGFSRQFEWSVRLERTIEIFQDLLDIGEFDIPVLSRWMFGGSIKEGSMDMGVLGQLFYGEFNLESLNHQLQSIYLSSSPLQKEQVERFVRRWEIENLSFLKEGFEASKIYEKGGFTFKVDGYIHRASKMETLGIGQHQTLVEKAKNATNLFYRGVSEGSWGAIREAVREALEGYILTGIYSSLLRMKINFAAIKAIELRKSTDLIAGDPTGYGNELVTILFDLSHHYGFGSDWVAATIFDYPSIYSKVKVEKDDWPSTPQEWLSTSPEDVYVKEIFLTDCATLIYAKRCGEMTGGMVEGLEDAMCNFCTSFWEEMGERLVPENFRADSSFKRRGSNCNLKVELKKK
jgi:hypothetical protein